MKKGLLMAALVSSLILTGCGQEQLYRTGTGPCPLDRVCICFRSIHRRRGYHETKKERLLRGHLWRKKMVSLPKSYRTLQTFGMFFTLNDLELQPTPTEVVYLCTRSATVCILSFVQDTRITCPSGESGGSSMGPRNKGSGSRPDESTGSHSADEGTTGPACLH